MTGVLVYWLVVDRFSFYFEVGCLVVWLFGCLVVWLFGCLVVCVFGWFGVFLGRFIFGRLVC
jgi:hypothetical protein